jgi:hypothetical protein
MVENGNAENLQFQLKQLQAEGKNVGVIKKHLEEDIWRNSEKKLSPEHPHWKVIDKDKGILFARKGDKHMDIIEGEDEIEGYKYKDIIIYDSNPSKDIMVRAKKEPLDKNA